jgi:hypothetical protein
MAFGIDHAVFDHLDDAVHTAPTPTHGLFSKIIAGACTRIPVLSKAGKATQLGRLTRSEAWTDAALALIEFELPAWKLRRVAFEDGEWICSLSRQPNVPFALDDTADAHHELLPLAILLAFLQARRRTGLTPEAVATVPGIKPAVDLVCCDNFA